MRHFIAPGRGAKTGPSFPVPVMAPEPAEKDHARSVGELLATFSREGWRGGALRAQLADRFPDRPPDDIEDAVQSACAAFLAEGQGITDPRAAYAWIRTAAHRALTHELRRRRRQVAADPGEGPIGEAAAEGPGPAEELIGLEDEADLDVLVREVASSLSGTRRDVLALWAAGRRRSEIAVGLAVPERVVKRALEELMAEARSTLARRAGGGCEEGEAIVLRLRCGLASASEAARAKLHLDGCGRCSSFSESLEAWREKAGAILPLPAAEVASPGLLGRAAARVGDALGSARRQLLGGGAQVKGRAVAGVGSTGDPTPLAGVRPGAVAAVLAGCLAVGGGATYCAQQGVDPLGAAKGLIAGIEEPGAGHPTGEPQAKAPVTPAYEPAPEEAPTYRPEEEAPPAAEPTATESQAKPEAGHATPEAEPEPEPEPQVEEVTPPAEQSFEPASPDYPATESEPSPSSSSTGSNTTESPAAAQPKAVAAGEAPQFGGP
jgi:DNA-directed RNA polymerase specialized sigma24 family protein